MKKDNRLVLLIILVLVFVIGIVFIIIGATKKEDQNKKEDIIPYEEVENNDKVVKKQLVTKTYKFNDKKYEFVFNKVSIYSKLEENQIVENDRKVEDGYYFNYCKLLVNIKYNNNVIFEDLDLFPIFESDNNKNLKNKANEYMKTLSYFSDYNGKKYLLLIGSDGSQKTYRILNLDKKTTLFSFYGDINDDYSHERFKKLESKFKVNLSSYFKDNRKSVILNNNLIGFFRIDEFNKEFVYMEIKIKYGLVDTKRTTIKVLSDEQIFDSSLEYPIVYYNE